MVNLKAFFLPKVVQFILISIIRICGVIGIGLVIGAEIYLFVHNVKGYVAGMKAGDIGTTSHIINGEAVVEKGWCGFVPETTVPTHTGGIFFSTYFAFINILFLFCLLVSELAPPLPAITSFYLRWFPPLSEESSVTFLGSSMMWIACSILSSNMNNYSIVSAWFLFIVGVLNLILGVVVGNSIRGKRAIFQSDKSKLPTFTPATAHSSQAKRKGDNVSYPAAMEIGFPAPAAGTRSAQLGGAFDVSAYIHQQASPRASEMVERQAMSPSQIGIHRSRSGKGVVTIKAEPEEIPDHDDDSCRNPPSYGTGPAAH